MPHKVFDGDRPSVSLLLPSLTPVQSPPAPPPRLPRVRFFPSSCKSEPERWLGAQLQNLVRNYASLWHSVHATNFARFRTRSYSCDPSHSGKILHELAPACCTRSSACFPCVRVRARARVRVF